MALAAQAATPESPRVYSHPSISDSRNDHSSFYATVMTHEPGLHYRREGYESGLAARTKSLHFSNPFRLRTRPERQSAATQPERQPAATQPERQPAAKQPERQLGRQCSTNEAHTCRPVPRPRIWWWIITYNLSPSSTLGLTPKLLGTHSQKTSDNNIPHTWTPEGDEDSAADRDH